MSKKKTLERIIGKVSNFLEKGVFAILNLTLDKSERRKIK